MEMKGRFLAGDGALIWRFLGCTDRSCQTDVWTVVWNLHIPIPIYAQEGNSAWNLSQIQKERLSTWRKQHLKRNSTPNQNLNCATFNNGRWHAPVDNVSHIRPDLVICTWARQIAHAKVEKKESVTQICHRFFMTSGSIRLQSDYYYYYYTIYGVSVQLLITQSCPELINGLAKNSSTMHYLNLKRAPD